MTVEIFAPKETDFQTPHEQDELYIVIGAAVYSSLMVWSIPSPRRRGYSSPGRRGARFSRFLTGFRNLVIFYGRVGAKGSSILRNGSRQLYE